METNRRLAGIPQGYKDLLHRLKTYDETTYRHSIRTSRFVGYMHGIAPMASFDQGELTLAPLLHDSGKLSVPVALIRHEGELSEAEKQTVDEHTSHGYELLVRLGSEVIARVARDHHLPDLFHARLDNPSDLLTAMTAIADVWDALRSHRPYHATHTIDQTVKILIEKWRANPIAIEYIQILEQGAELGIFEETGLLLKYRD